MNNNKQFGISENIEKKFDSVFSWSLTGSLIFEMSKLIHNIFLAYVIEKTVYGTIGSIFSILFFMARIIDFGGSFSVAPFFNLIFKSKKHFIKITTYFFLLPTIFIGFGCMLFVYEKGFFTNKYLFFLVLLTAILEGVRSLFRQMIHINFLGKQAIFSELMLFFIFLSIIWGSFVGFSTSLTPQFMFFVYFIDSFLGVAVFSFLIRKIYNQLPILDISDFQLKQLLKQLLKKIPKTRFFNFCLRLSKELFNSNFITPLFAYRFGLIDAGLFYLASNIAASTQAVVKTAVGYSGNALLANLKTRPLNEKIAGFNNICEKLVLILIPAVILLVINYKELILFSGKNNNILLVTFSSLYLVLSFSESFFSVYEQFYIIEERIETLLFLKFLEFILLFAVIYLGRYSTPIFSFLNILFVRIISFFAMAIDAYIRWGIKPKFKTSFLFVAICFFISLFVKIFLSIIS